MAFVDLEGRRQFSPAHHVHASLTGTSWSDIGTACGVRFAGASRLHRRMRGAQRDRTRLSVAGLQLEVLRRGAGRPLLLLHGFQTVPPDAPFLAWLGRHAEIIAPSHPGFGDSARPADIETVYDLVHLYLEVLDTCPTSG